MDKLKNTITEEVISNTEAYKYGIISAPKIYGYLNHNSTKTSITCYEPIGWFKSLMLNWCFGLKYVKNNG